MSIVLVGVMLVAALNAAGASKLALSKLSDRGKGMLLAQEIMTEILALQYEDPALGSGSFGRTGAKNAPGDRSLYDDVDDYDDWSASPPQDKDGVPLGDTDGYTREVSVDWVLSNDLKQTSVSASGIKRIWVFVSHADGVRISLYALRTVMWENPADVMGGGP